MLYYLFLSQYTHHQLLHSFPTRRSSDLVRSDRDASMRSGGSSRRVSVGLRSSRPSADSSTVTELPLRAAAARASRSEEHTSELQSQFHLVCRLLLEKKKK